MIKTPSPQTIYLKDYTVPDYLIHNVDLTFSLDEEKTQVISKLTLQRNPESGTEQRPLILLGEQLDLISVTLAGQVLTANDYYLTEESLIIKEVPCLESFTLVIENNNQGGQPA